MSFRINVPVELRADWAPVIERQFDLTLSPLRSLLSSVQISFTQIHEQGSSWFQCELAGRFPTGDSVTCNARNSDGHVAVADALSRARREVSRRSWASGARQSAMGSASERGGTGQSR